MGTKALHIDRLSLSQPILVNLGMGNVYCPQLPIYDRMTDEECAQVYRDYGYELMGDTWKLRARFIPPNGMTK